MLLIILSVVGMIRVILIIVIFFLIIKWILKLFSPVYSEKNQGPNNRTNFEDGETSIQFKSQEKKNKSQNKGEYVDFEEIE